MGVGRRRRLTPLGCSGTLLAMRLKPRGLDHAYGAQFDDPSVVAAYGMRPPYADRAMSLIAGLAGGASGHIVDMGCGTGEVARRIAPSVRAVTAIDRSERMIRRARELPGGDAPNLEWIVGRIEAVPLPASVTVALAAESFHWFDWDVVCRLLAARATVCPLVLMDRCEVAPPWSNRLKPIIANYSTNRDFEPYDLVEELVARSGYSVDGRTTSGPALFTQTIDAYITSIHSRNGFSRDRMTAESAAEFDEAVRTAVRPYATNDLLPLQIETRVVWGRCGVAGVIGPQGDEVA